MKLIFFLLWLCCGVVNGNYVVDVSLYDHPQTTLSSTPVGGVDEWNKETLQKMADLKHQGKSDGEILKECVDAKAFLVKFTAALGMGLCGLDMQAAYDGADCAIENNCGQLLVGFLGVLAGAGAALTVSDYLDAFEIEGWDGVCRLAKMDAEVVMMADQMGRAVGPGGAIAGDVAGILLASGKRVGLKINGVVCWNMPEALQALQKITPAFKDRKMVQIFANWCEKQGIAKAELGGLKPQVKPGGKRSEIRGILPHVEQGRKLPGTAHASGMLEELPQMLRGTHNNVGLIPKEVGDMLQGKQFRNFDEFRGCFWEAVGKTKYAQEFGELNLSRITNGKAPIVSPEQGLGKRVHYELHHKTPIVQEGAVFDLSNMIIVTPRYHQEILARGYHYGVGK